MGVTPMTDARTRLGLSSVDPPEGTRVIQTEDGEALECLGCGTRTGVRPLVCGCGGDGDD